MVIAVDFQQRRILSVDGRPTRGNMEGRGTLLTFSIENWITVVIMAALGFMLFALVSQFFMSGGVQNYLPASLTRLRPGA